MGNLRGLAERGSLALGVALNPDLARNPRRAYRDILSSCFSLEVIQHGLLWRVTEPSQGATDFSRTDWLVQHYRADGSGNLRGLRGHPLYFPAANPAWLLHTDLKARDLVRILRRRIKSVISRYRSNIREWVVVNEPHYPGESNRRGYDVMHSKIGPDYIDIAFEAAREADPSAILIYNDFGNETPGGPTTEYTLETVSRLRSKGLLDGVGLQMHLNGRNPPRISELIQALDDYPLPVYITELDVNLSGVGGSRQERFMTQAIIYSDVMLACLETGACKSISVSGIGDRYSWLEKYLGQPDADGTLFDDNFDPKPAYFAFYELLQRRFG
jgi:endo-1,4-beta-xylanase